MIKRLFMWAFTCSTALSLCAQTTHSSDSTAYNDSIEIILNEINIVADNVITKTDCKIITPSKNKISASTSGLDLLQKLAVPGISINPLTSNITLVSGGTLSLYIDGIPASVSQIASLDPADVLKIEYHDAPGVKYGDADAVLNYITRKRNNGGQLLCETMNCIGNGKFATLDEIAVNINQGKSSWSINAGYAQMKRNNWVRDYEEIWHYPDHEIKCPLRQKHIFHHQTLCQTELWQKM